MRVYEFARKFDKDSKDFLQELRSEFGFDIKSHLSGISQDQINAVILAYSSKDDLAVQVDDSHKQNLKEAFNETINLKEPEFISYDLVKDDEESKKKEVLTINEKLDFGIFSGDDIEPPPSKLDEKAIEELKKENEKAVENSIKSAEESREKYAKTVHNITEDPDNWATPSVNTQQEVIVEKQHWWSRLFGWWFGG